MGATRIAAVPGSKSITNRALLLAALSDKEYLLKGAQFSDDSRYFLGALKALGFSVKEDEMAKTVRIAGTNGRVPKKNAEIYVGSAGTAARFLTAMLAFSDGIYTIQASEQMAGRPMKPLFDALTSLGAEFTYLGEAGHLPVLVKGMFADGKGAVPESNAGEGMEQESYAAMGMEPKPYAGEGIVPESYAGESNVPVDFSGERGCVGRAVERKRGALKVSLDISESTQYLSALLMTASMLPCNLIISVTSEKKRGSYIEITRRMMDSFGIRTEFDGAGYTVFVGKRGTVSCEKNRTAPERAGDTVIDTANRVAPEGAGGTASDRTNCTSSDRECRAVLHETDCTVNAVYQIEPDVSAACYFYAAVMLAGGSVQVRHVHKDSMQGDMKFLDLLERMGATVVDLSDGIRVSAPGFEDTQTVCRNGNTFPGLEVNMNDFSDQAITLAAIAPFASSPTVISGIAHIRRQESDRLHGIAENLARMGIRTEESEDSIKIWPGTPKPCEIETYDDHRMAMGFALVGLRVPGMTIKNPQCCRKTFKEYFTEMERVFGLKFPKT